MSAFLVGVFVVLAFFVALRLVSSSLKNKAEKKRRAEEAAAAAEAEKRKAEEAATAAAEAERRRAANPYEYIHDIHVAGVTFKNGRRSRQTILRQIFWHDPPYNKRKLNVHLKQEIFEDKPAVSVWVEEEQIGYVPAEHAQYVYDNFDRIVDIYEFSVYGGGKTPSGESINFGASFYLRLRKNNTPS